MKYYEESAIPVCDECTSLGYKLKQCHKCNKEFCKHYSSGIDIQYCSNCMDDVVLERSLVVKKTKIIKASTGELVAKHSGTYTLMKLTGSDKLYAEHRISAISNDDEFDVAIEYHDTMLSLLKSCREDVRRARMDKIRNIKLAPSTAAQAIVAAPAKRKRKVTTQAIINDSNAIRVALAQAYFAINNHMPSEQQIDALIAQMPNIVQQGS